MKKNSLLICFVLLVFCSVNSYAQKSEKLLWHIFFSGSFEKETNKTDSLITTNITVLQDGDTFVWGDENIFTILKKQEEKQGQLTTKVYAFVDKNEEKGVLLYMNDKTKSKMAQHMLFIVYDDKSTGKVYLSEKPKKL